MGLSLREYSSHTKSGLKVHKKRILIGRMAKFESGNVFDLYWLIPRTLYTSLHSYFHLIVGKKSKKSLVLLFHISGMWREIISEMLLKHSVLKAHFLLDQSLGLYNDCSEHLASYMK